MLFDILLIIVSNSEFIILSSTFANARPSLALTSLRSRVLAHISNEVSLPEWFSSIMSKCCFSLAFHLSFAFGTLYALHFRHFAPVNNLFDARAHRRTPKRKLLRFSLNLTEQTLSCVGIHKLKNIIFEFVLIWFWRVANGMRVQPSRLPINSICPIPYSAQINFASVSVRIDTLIKLEFVSALNNFIKVKTMLTINGSMVAGSDDDRRNKQTKMASNWKMTLIDWSEVWFAWRNLFLIIAYAIFANGRAKHMRRTKNKWNYWFVIYYYLEMLRRNPFFLLRRCFSND